jgi:hypothetical protein
MVETYFDTMDKAVEYKGYLITACVERWVNGFYAASYTIKSQPTGPTLRHGRLVAFHEIPDEATKAAIEFGKHFVADVLPILLHPPAEADDKDRSEEPPSASA